ncbi:hypothetical protein [Desulfofalx alkaliphila]|nr:hypothetical protein [Desulfofalx alkaliphila]
MRYLLTWVEGNEVHYRFVNSKDEIDYNLSEGRHLMVTSLEKKHEDK